MTYLEITVGKSLNPNTGEQWLKADAKVSLEEGEVPKDVFEKVKAEINSWLPNPNDQRGTYVVPVPDKDLEQKPILMKELEDAKTTEEITIIYNEAPAAVKSDQEFFEAVIKAKQRVKQHTIIN